MYRRNKFQNFLDNLPLIIIIILLVGLIFSLSITAVYCHRLGNKAEQAWKEGYTVYLDGKQMEENSVTEATFSNYSILKIDEDTKSIILKRHD